MNDGPISPGRLRPGRVRLLVGGAVATALGAVFALVMAILPTSASAATTICNSQSSNSGGTYYQMWTNGQGSACMTLNSSLSYSTSWSGVGDFVDGVGWNPGSNQTVSFSGNLNASGGTTLVSLYGWSTNPLVEYYVEEDYVGSPNTAGTYMGQMTSDGGTYNIYEHQQVNQPSIQGTATFEQYLAIRTSPTSSGTITTQNFFNAWASHGMNLGSMNYQILATEAWGGGSGNDSFTVSHSSGPPSSSPPSSNPPSSNPPSSNPPSSNPPSTPPATGGCTAAYSVTNSWQGGFEANVVVANGGSSTINGWTVHFTLASGQTISSLWSGVNSGTTGAVTVKNASYNGTLAPGASTSFGFTANGGSSPATNVSCSSP